MRVQLAGLSPQLEIKYQSKARDQKQLYRLNETKSHSGGGFKICQAMMAWYRIEIVLGTVA